MKPIFCVSQLELPIQTSRTVSTSFINIKLQLSKKLVLPVQKLIVQFIKHKFSAFSPKSELETMLIISTTKLKSLSVATMMIIDWRCRPVSLFPAHGPSLYPQLLNNRSISERLFIRAVDDSSGLISVSMVNIGGMSHKNETWYNVAYNAFEGVNQDMAHFSCMNWCLQF